MFSTPLICCSSGVATVRDTVSADAPGYTVVICTVGGTISGYCATGRIASAPSPSSVTKALKTVANLPYFPSLWRDHAVRRNRHHHVLRLVRQHCAVRHEEGR